MKFRYILFITGGALLLSLAYSVPKLISECKESKHCGKVLYKVQEEQHHKYSVSYNPTLVVDFGNGRIRDIHTTNYTYLSSQVGDSICFVLEDTFVDGSRHRGLWMRTVVVTVYFALCFIVWGYLHD